MINMKKKNGDEASSSKKENKKVRTDKQFKDNPVREGENNSINDEGNQSAYPHKSTEDKQFKTQPEFIDRNSESKNKS